MNSRKREYDDDKKCRVALLVVDGLSLDQWVSVREILRVQNSSLIMRESAVFAWMAISGS